MVSDKKHYSGKIDGKLHASVQACPSGQREFVHALKIFHQKPSKIIRNASKINFHSEIQNKFPLSVCHYSQQEKQQKQQQYGAIKIAKKSIYNKFFVFTYLI